MIGKPFLGRENKMFRICRHKREFLIEKLSELGRLLRDHTLSSILLLKPTQLILTHRTESFPTEQHVVVVLCFLLQRRWFGRHSKGKDVTSIRFHILKNLLRVHRFLGKIVIKIEMRVNTSHNLTHTVLRVVEFYVQRSEILCGECDTDATSIALYVDDCEPRYLVFECGCLSAGIKE